MIYNILTRTLFASRKVDMSDLLSRLGYSNLGLARELVRSRAGGVYGTRM